MAPLPDLLADLRRSLPLVAAITVTGAALAGGLALRQEQRQVSTATLLVSSLAGDPRVLPVRPEELEAFLVPGILETSAAAAGIAPAELAGAVEIAQQATPGLFDLSVALPDGETARRAANALARDLVTEHGRLREQKVALAREGLSPEYVAARKAREDAEAAFLADVDAGSVEEGEAALERSPSPANAAVLGKAKARRERLQFELERAVLEERYRRDVFQRTTLDVDSHELRVSVWAEAGVPVPRRGSAKRAAVSGGALSFAVAFAGVLAFRELRRSRGDDA